MDHSLALGPALHEQLARHLRSEEVEQVAFLFTEPYDAQGPLRIIDFYPVPPEGFEFQSEYHVALTDETRAIVIKRAWDCGGCLVEAHSHEDGDPVRFSGSDLAGFKDWVPHVRWRLRGRPYYALVFGDRTFDALVWANGAADPRPLSSLTLDGGAELLPTNRTIDSIRAVR